MMKLKNNKGVTLVALTITVIVLLILTNIVIYNSSSHLAMKNVNNLYSDIDSISTKVSDYYLTNNSLPIYGEQVYFNDKEALKTLFQVNGGTGDEINPNDDGPYYVLNLSRLENLTLNYGRDYGKWAADSSYQDYQDLYIINGVTHQIYYPKGITYRDAVYFTMDLGDEVINKIETASMPDGVTLTVNEVNKNTISGETKVMIEANITLDLNADYTTENLQYGWKVAGDTSDVTYTKFTLDENNAATLTSKLLENSTDYYLYIKVFDINGYEHIVEQIATTETMPYLPSDNFTRGAGTDLSTGLVIEDELGNQYVWVEVPRTDEVYPTATADLDFDTLTGTNLTNAYTAIENDLHTYTSLYRDETDYTDEYYENDTTGLTQDEYNTLKQTMLKSVYVNEGFWIGRYEAGIANYRTDYTEIDSSSAIPSSKANQYPYTNVHCREAQELASRVDSGDYTSSLMFGVQWDLVLKYLEVKAVEQGENLATIQSELNENSTSWGNYLDTTYNITKAIAKYSLTEGESWLSTPYNKEVEGKVLLTTGASDTFCKQNIYDLAGNAWEWTLEYAADETYQSAARGGNEGYSGSSRPVSYRNSYGITHHYFDCRFSRFNLLRY